MSYNGAPIYDRFGYGLGIDTYNTFLNRSS